MNVAGNRKTKSFVVLSLLIFSFAFFFPTNSMAVSISGNKLVVQKDGDVWLTFKGSDANHTSVLQYQGRELFNNKTSGVGERINLGKFKAGDVIELNLKNVTTGDIFSAVGSNANLTNIGQDQLVAAFEDLAGGGDRDFNDLKFLFENLGTQNPEGSPNPFSSDGGSGSGGFVNPEPTTVLLMGSGLLWLAAWRRNKKGSSQ